MADTRPPPPWGWFISCPGIIDGSGGAELVKTVRENIYLGSALDHEPLVRFVRDAINEKMARDFGDVDPLATAHLGWGGLDFTNG